MSKSITLLPYTPATPAAPNPSAKSQLPKIGDKVCVEYRYWTNGGECVTKFRHGSVAYVTPFEDGTGGYNVCIKSWVFKRNWHAIDNRNAKLTYNEYPIRAKINPFRTQ